MEVQADIEREIEKMTRQIEKYRSERKKMFTTSSFQTHSLPLLHILSKVDRTIPVCFINTGYHFPETIAFRDRITEAFGLNLVDLKSLVPKNLQRDVNGNLFFASDPDYCCFLNKVQPLQPALSKMDVWINGIRADQNANRKNMKEEERTREGAMRYHPMLAWTNKMIHQYRLMYNLPAHPLEVKGYLSIGCEPCTKSFFDDPGREGRWYGLKKQECGLHTDLVAK